MTSTALRPGAMDTAFRYEATDIPEGLTLTEHRRRRTTARKRRGRLRRLLP